MKPKYKNIFHVLFIVLLFLNAKSNAQSIYHPQQMVIPTRWAKKVNPLNVLNEYPRPQLVRYSWKNLNGLWDYSITQKGTVSPTKMEGKILVPFALESALSGVKKTLMPNQNLWYKRTFFFNPQTGHKTLLHFGGVDFEATIFVNGKKVGKHSGGYTAFEFDITNFLNKSKNQLTIEVSDSTDFGVGPRGKQTLHPQNIFYTSNSGIWQSVWLETVPKVYLKDLIISPDLDKKSVFITPKININEKSYTIEVIAKSKGKTLSRSTGLADQKQSLRIAGVHPWSPDDPFLYDLVVRVLQGGKVVDEVKSYFGMRKISIMKDKDGYDRIALNNKPYYNLGVLDQGFWPDGLYTAPTDEALQFDIKAMKAMGFNTIRKHIKVEPARWYYHCDRLGMLVWQDMVNPNQDLPPGAKEEFEKEAKETVSQLKNYPSITTWVLFNEKWGQFDQERLTKELKNWDPTRLVNGHSGEYLYVNHQLRSPSPNAYVNADMTDVHSYPYPMLPVKQAGKAMICGEYGGIGVPVEGHLWDDLTAGWGYDGVGTPAKMEKTFTKMIDTLVELKKQGLSGSIYTQPYDVESEQNGLMTYDRELSKIPVGTIRNIQAKLNPPTRNWKTSAKALILNPVKDESKSYAERLKEYQNGIRDSSLLRSLTIMAYKEKDFERGIRFYDEYFKKVKFPYIENNVKFFSEHLTKERDSVLNYFVEHYAKEAKTLNNQLSERLMLRLQDILFESQIKPLLSDSTKLFTVMQAISQYKQFDGKRIMENVISFNLEKLKAGDRKFISCFMDSALEYERTFDDAEYNQWAWQVFTCSNETKYLEIALKWVNKDLLKLKESDWAYPFFLDTKANLLYKLGDKDSALKIQQIAVAKAPKSDQLKENFEKMKKGSPTW